MDIIGKLKSAIASGDENAVYFELQRLLVSIAWTDDRYAELEDTAYALYNFLAEKKRVKDIYIATY